MKAENIIINAVKSGVHLYLKDGRLAYKLNKGSFPDDIKAMVVANKDLVIEHLELQLTQSNLDRTVQAYPRESQTLPTSFSQQRLWFIDHLKGGSPEYNMPVALTVKGELSLPVVERVFQRIIARHEVLRTNYYDEAGVVYQYIHEPENVAFSVVYQDLRSLQGEAQQAQIKARISEVITTAFNLAEDLLLKVLYLATGEDTGVLLFNMHHIASDGWSMQVLTNEFVRLYEAYSQGEAEPLPQLALQYGDYAQWQRTHITDTVLDKQLSYWLAQLDEAPAVHNLTLDYPRPAEKQYHGAQVVSAFSAQTADALLAAAKRHQLTPFMLLHGALSLVLSRHSNSHDIIMGTPVANRLQAELAPLIGFFVNTLVLRVNTQHDSLAEYYAHVRATHLAGQSHQDVPFEQLVEKLKVPRSRAHGPLFQIMVTTNTDYGLHEHQPLQLAGIEVAPYQSDIVQAKFDLKVDLAIDEQGGGVSWSYDTSLFSEAHIEQLSTHLQQLLEALADTRGEWDIALSQLDMLSAKEVRQLVHECNARSDKATQAWGNIVSHFTAQAQRQSTQTAVVCGDSKMSYGELDRQSNQLARYLMTRHHVQRGTLVGLCMDRSIEMVVSILAILKAGGAMCH
ncbi:AMP-binding protein [Pseudoalteromonas sp. M8]|nr:AMP-binding protein [Pseudoalteromonas sp. M8]